MSKTKVILKFILSFSIVAIKITDSLIMSCAILFYARVQFICYCLTELVATFGENERHVLVNFWFLHEVNATNSGCN